MKKLLLILCVLPSITFSQRNIPYPIILVHGLGGGSETWAELRVYLRNAGLNAETSAMSYCLNADDNKYTSNKATDVRKYGSWEITDNDIFTINFNTCETSNESAIAKQGYALKLAIEKVLFVTEADKVVLIGHSMGGLAIREYLQNSTNWQGDGKHHVAKVVTIGTPHGGSDLGSGGINLGLFLKNIDEKSEAVRDLRNSYVTSKYFDAGIYLFGGTESRAAMTTNIAGSSAYYNIDVNCNGTEGDKITGLNTYSTIPLDLGYACIVGGPTVTDGVVKSERQNLNNYYKVSAKTYDYNCNGNTNCHIDEPKKALVEIMSAMDDFDDFPYYPIIKVNKQYTGFFQKDINGNRGDLDTYTFNVPSAGMITLDINSTGNDIYAQTILIDPDGNEVFRKKSENITNGTVEAKKGGKYKLLTSGSFTGDYKRYSYTVYFCQYLDKPTITATGTTTFCEGASATLSVAPGFEGYQWFRDGIKIDGITQNTELKVSINGVYTVEAYKCAKANQSSNSTRITVNPIPAKPVITMVEDLGFLKLQSSNSNGNQWYFGGKVLDNATERVFRAITPGEYFVKTTLLSCANTSDVFKINILSTDDFAFSENVKVFPNPSQGKLNIELPFSKITELSIFTMNGIEVLNKTFKDFSETKELNLTLASGTYLLRVQADGREVVKKIILKN